MEKLLIEPVTVAFFESMKASFFHMVGVSIAMRTTTSSTPHYRTESEVDTIGGEDSTRSTCAISQLA